MAVKTKKKRIYYFSRIGGLCFIHLRRSYSNIFVTLTDMRNSVLKCVTSGSPALLVQKGKKKHLWL